MQLVFIHAQLAMLETSVEQLNLLSNAFNKNDVYLDRKIMAFLDDRIAVLKQQNSNELVCTFEGIKSALTMAMQGISPYTLEKVSIGKGHMVKGVCYRVLQQLQDTLFPLLEKHKATLEKAGELMKQLLLGALQREKFDAERLVLPISPQKLETLWATMLHDDVLKMFVYNIKLIVTHQDALLVLESFLNQLKS